MSLYDSLSAKIYLMEKRFKENGGSPRFAGEAGKTESQPFVASAIEPWYLSADRWTATISHLKLGFYKILLALARIGLIIRGKPASNFTVFTRAGKDGLYICNYSYCYYKDFHHKIRNKTIATIIAATVLLSIIISLIFPGYPGVKAATYNFSQTSWVGGESALTASHATDQSTWTKYSAKDADIAAGAQLALSISSSWTQTDDGTTDAGFNNAGVTPLNTYVTGTGTGASVMLMIPPSQVIGLSPTAGNTQISLNWTAPAANGSAITSYKVYRGTTSGGETLLSSGGCSGLGSVLTCTDTGLTNGTTYYYKVSAVNAVGEGGQSSEVSQTPSPCGSVLTDVDGNTYNWVLIGTQCWFATNLKTGTRINGIANPTNNGVIEKYCFNDTDANCATDGGLYQWNEAMGYSASCNGTGESQPQCTTPVQGICPTGSHIPSHYEYTLLEKNVGSNPGAFPYDETTTGWLGTNEGTNLKTGGSSGFNGVLAGYRGPGGSFYGRGAYAYLWSSTEIGSGAWSRGLSSGYATVYRYVIDKANGFSVRCLKN